MGDIYQAPQADLSAEFKSVDGEYGSLEKGIRGEYQLKVGEVLSEAWSKTKGAKTKILLGLLLYCACIRRYLLCCTNIGYRPGLWGCRRDGHS